jgi:hypothetical protein
MEAIQEGNASEVTLDVTIKRIPMVNFLQIKIRKKEYD